MGESRVGVEAVVCAAALLGVLTLTRAARADFDKDAGDYYLKRRQLCYELADSVKNAPSWPGWVDQAFANWQAVSDKTGWQFRRCAPGETPDIVVTFAEGQAGDTAGGSFSGTRYDLKLVENVDGVQPNPKGPKVSGGQKGWDTSGATTMDPVRVVMHEITHAMRMHHPNGGWDTGNFEEPIGQGNHAAAISASDLAEARKGADDGKPPPQIAPKLPACFTDEAARAAFLKQLDDILGQLQAQMDELDQQLDPRPRNSGESAAEYQLYREQFYDALKADPARTSARQKSRVQVQSNIEAVRNAIRDAKSLALCGHASAGSVGSPGGEYVSGPSFGLRTGYSLPMGNADGAATVAGTTLPATALGDVASGRVPLQVDAGWGFTPNLYAGVSFQYAFVVLDSDKLGCNSPGVGCSGHDTTLAVNAQVHFLPAGTIDPWVGLGVGYEWLGINQSSGGQSSGGGYSGLEIASLQVGGDVQVPAAAGLTVGPFLSLDLDRFTSSSGGGTSADIPSPAVHGWLTLGVRGTYNLRGLTSASSGTRPL